MKPMRESPAYELPRNAGKNLSSTKREVLFRAGVSISLKDGRHSVSGCWYCYPLVLGA